MSALSCCKRCLIALFVIAVCIVLIHGWITYKSYLFTHKSVASVATKYAVSRDSTASYDVKKAFQNVHRDLSARYPGHILPASDLQWIFVNAGGWMGSICVVHASLTEYVLFFGTALDTSGHSGRYWANISNTLLTGEYQQWKEGELTTLVHKPGAVVYHEWGSVAAVHFKAGTWTVEYGRGFLPSTLGFAAADTLFSTLDFVSLFYMMRVYAKAMLLEAGYYMTHVQELFAG